MKRFVSSLVILSLVILALPACHTDVNNNGYSAQSPGNSVSTASVTDTDGDWFASYYRSGRAKESVDNAIVIRSAEELQAYAVQQIGLEPISARLCEEVFDNTAKYSDDFFSRHSLLVVFALEGSGSIRHKVMSVTAKDGVLQVCIDRHNPEIGTGDMAFWQIFIETDAVPVGWELEVVWQNVPLDSVALSPPVSALKSVTLESSQEAGVFYAVFQFSGIYSRLYPAFSDIWQLTRDGKELGGNDYGMGRGDEYENYRRVIENDETTFYIPIRLYLKAPVGIYVLLGNYQNEVFNTKPLNIIGYSDSTIIIYES